MNFMARARASGNSLILTIDRNIVQLDEIKEGDLLEVNVNKIIEKEE